MTGIKLTAAERETCINLNDASDTATIYTEQRPWITKLRKLHKSHPNLVTNYREGTHGPGGSPYAQATLPKTFITARPSKRVPESILSSEKHTGEHVLEHAR